MHFGVLGARGLRQPGPRAARTPAENNEKKDGGADAPPSFVEKW